MTRWHYCVAAAGAPLLLAGAFALGRVTKAAARPDTVVVPAAMPPAKGPDVAPTNVYAHNLLLRKGDHFRIYMRWLRGKLERTRAEVNPSFSEPQSFVLQIDQGVISVRLEDLTDFLNSGMGTGSSLKHIVLGAENGQLILNGKLHGILPVKVTAELSPLPDGRVQFHVVSIKMLSVPLKGLLGMMHVQLQNLVASPRVPGVELAGSDVRFDTEKLMPPPHIHGKLTSVTVLPQEIKVVYGHAGEEESHMERWHNFLRFSGGTLDLGKLTMHDVDLTMIDATQSPWFDLDLVNYKTQLVYGYTRTTAQSGMEIYLPEFNEIKEKKVTLPITMDWLKNRDSSLPSDVPIKNGKTVKASPS